MLRDMMENGMVGPARGKGECLPFATLVSDLSREWEGVSVEPRPESCCGKKESGYSEKQGSETPHIVSAHVHASRLTVRKSAAGDLLASGTMVNVA